MVRTQIQLTEEQARRLRAWAAENGVSLAEAIRRSVDRMLSDTTADLEARYARAATVIGSLEDPEGATDISTHHDRYLDKSFR
jgi:hypothetical protein